MQKRFASVIAIGRKIGLSDETGFAVAIFIALLIVSSTVIGYYVFLAPPPESYNTIYLLDANKKAVDYPEVLIANQNSTFSVYVNVVNHMGGTENQAYQVQVRIAPNLSGIQPAKTYDLSLRNGETWQDSVSITLNQVGSYSVVFELWQIKEAVLQLTPNSCVLNISVIS